MKYTLQKMARNYQENTRWVLVLLKRVSIEGVFQKLSPNFRKTDGTPFRAVTGIFFGIQFFVMVAWPCPTL